MRALEHHHMTLQPHHTCHIIIHVMPFSLSLMNSFDINENHTQHHGALEHHHMTLQPHHTRHIIIHVMSFPFSLMNSFDINGNHIQH